MSQALTDLQSLQGRVLPGAGAPGPHPHPRGTPARPAHRPRAPGGARPRSAVGLAATRHPAREEPRRPPQVRHQRPLLGPRPAHPRPARDGPRHLQQPPRRHAGDAARADPRAGARPVKLFTKILQIGLVDRGPSRARSVGTRDDRRVSAAPSRSARWMPARATAAKSRSAACSSPVYDLERFGLHFVASPRHADLLLVTGPVTLNMADAAPEDLGGDARSEARRRRRRLRPRLRRVRGQLRRGGQRSRTSFRSTRS